MSFDDSEIKEIEFITGEVLFRENERTFHFYIIQEGQVEVFKSDDTGKEMVLASVGAGQSIGEFAMIDQQPRSATARATTDVKAVLITENAYRQLLSELPEWAIAVLTSLVKRVRHMNTVIRGNEQIDADVLRELDSHEFTYTGITITDSNTLIDDNPFLSDPDAPDLAPAEHQPMRKFKKASSR